MKPLQRSGLVDLWDDTRIQAGDFWRSEIQKALNEADVAILLFSADFLASDFIASVELPNLLIAEQRRGLCILAVLLKPCQMHDTIFAELQMINPVDNPLIRMSEAEQESVWVKLAERVKACLGKTPVRTAEAEPSRVKHVWFMPVERNPFFTGRDQIIDQLRKVLSTLGKAAICGMGGMGKSQVAAEYAYRYRDQYDHVFWLRAATEQELLAAYVEAARLLALHDSREEDQMRAVHAAQSWFEQHGNWLLILDNADQPELLLKYRIRNVRGHLLVTTRCHSAQTIGIGASAVIDRMTPPEAVEFLKRRVARPDGESREEAALEELVQELGYLPLAMEQAAAYITANQSRFQDYLRGYRNRRLAVLTTPIMGEYPESVATTWDLNFREVASVPHSADLLRLSAFLNPDAIPLELIARGASELGPALAKALEHVLDDPLLLDETLEPLYRYSLIRRDIKARTYSIHPIMQAVLLDRMSSEDQREWAGRAVNAVKIAFPKPNYENWEACDRMIPQVAACVSLIEKWGFDFSAAGFLMRDAGVYLRRRARFQEAIAMQQQLLAMQERTLGAMHTAVAEALLNLAKLKRHLGYYEEAEPLLRRALSIFEAAHGPVHRTVAKVLTSLSALCCILERLDEAESLARKSLAICGEILDERDRELPKCLTNLAVVLDKQDKLEEAEQALKQSIEIEKSLPRQDHHDLSSSLTILAGIYTKWKRFDEARPLLEQALELDKSMGDDHPGIAWSLTGLAELDAEQGDFNSAKNRSLQAFMIRCKTLGAEHPLTKQSQEYAIYIMCKTGMANGEIKQTLDKMAVPDRRANDSPR